MPEKYYSGGHAASIFINQTNNFHLRRAKLKTYWAINMFSSDPPPPQWPPTTQSHPHPPPTLIHPTFTSALTLTHSGNLTKPLSWSFIPFLCAFFSFFFSFLTFLSSSYLPLLNVTSRSSSPHLKFVPYFVHVLWTIAVIFLDLSVWLISLTFPYVTQFLFFPVTLYEYYFVCTDERYWH